MRKVYIGMFCNKKFKTNEQKPPKLFILVDF